MSTGFSPSHGLFFIIVMNTGALQNRSATCNTALAPSPGKESSMLRKGSGVEGGVVANHHPHGATNRRRTVLPTLCCKLNASYLSSSLGSLQAAHKGYLEVLPRAVTAVGGATVPLFLDRHELTAKGGRRCRGLACRHGQGLMSSLNTTIVPGWRKDQNMVPCARDVQEVSTSMRWRRSRFRAAPVHKFAERILDRRYIFQQRRHGKSEALVMSFTGTGRAAVPYLESIQ